MSKYAVFTKGLSIWGILSFGFLAGCGGGTNQSLNKQLPTITSISPNTTGADGGSFTLTINGTNFVAASMVNFGGAAPATTFVNSTQLTAAISAATVVTAGTAAVTVTNPALGGGTSNAVNFTITSGTNPGTNPSSVAVAPDPTGKFGKFAYVANYGSNSVSMYSIDTATGALAPIGTVAAGSSPVSVAVDRSGKFAYAANNDSHDISMYTIDATTGILTPIGKIPVEGRATSVTVHPSGKFAYVGEGYTLPNGTPDRVSMYTINARTGALTLVGTIATGSPATSLAVKIAIDPSENFVYAAGDGCALDTYPGYVSVYTINSTTGALTPIGSPLPAGWCSSSVTVDPFGKFAYVADQGGPDVATYTINANTGALTPIGSIAAGIGPSSVAVDPTGKFAYVTNYYDGVFGHDVLMYTIDATTGALTRIGTIAAGTGPRSVAVDPTGKFAYVTNFDSNNVSMYSIDPATGALTLIGTVGS
jgi:6-phosphogluconolactonase